MFISIWRIKAVSNLIRIKVTTNGFSQVLLKNNIFGKVLAKKESRLKFYRMSFALHSIDICIFFMLQTEPGRSRLYLRAIYAHPIKIQLSLFVEQLKKFLVFI